MRIIQYIHRPNSTELGIGNTHETYMLINSEHDLSEVFPPGLEVSVGDSLSTHVYPIKSADGREFRVNQMGSLYRDYNVQPGDEVYLTSIRFDNGSNTFSLLKTIIEL